MTLAHLRSLDLSARRDPAALLERGSEAPDLRTHLEAWLVYQRHEFLRKLRDLDDAQLVAHAIAPVELSVMGLVRHMTQMEHHYVSWGLGGGDRVLAYGEDDFAGATLDALDTDLTRYFAEVERAQAAIAAVADLDSPGLGHGRPLSAILVKMIDEYALHAGQAHMLRFAALGQLKR